MIEDKHIYNEGETIVIKHFYAENPVTGAHCAIRPVDPKYSQVQTKDDVFIWKTDYDAIADDKDTTVQTCLIVFEAITEYKVSKQCTLSLKLRNATDPKVATSYEKIVAEEKKHSENYIKLLACPLCLLEGASSRLKVNQAVLSSTEDVNKYVSGALVHVPFGGALLSKGLESIIKAIGNIADAKSELLKNRYVKIQTFVVQYEKLSQKYRECKERIGDFKTSEECQALRGWSDQIKRHVSGFPVVCAGVGNLTTIIAQNKIRERIKTNCAMRCRAN